MLAELPLPPKTQTAPIALVGSVGWLEIARRDPVRLAVQVALRLEAMAAWRGAADD